MIAAGVREILDESLDESQGPAREAIWQAANRGVAQILAAGKASTTPTFRFREKQRLAGYALAVALAPLLTVLFAILRGDRG